jgi:putative peptidoglycan lipid II flippase
MAGFKKTMSRGLRSTALLILPCAALLIALAEPICSLFIAGRFSVEDMLLVAQALRIWSIGLVFYACMMFMLGAFYSLKDTRTPAIANLGWSFAQVAGYLVLTGGIGAWKGLGINGAPLVDIVFYLAVFATLVVLLRRKIGEFAISNFISLFIRMTVCAIIAGLVAAYVSTLLAGIATGITGSLIQVAGAGVVGLFIAFGLAVLLRVEEMRFVSRLFDRIRGKRTKL